MFTERNLKCIVFCCETEYIEYHAGPNVTPLLVECESKAWNSRGWLAKKLSTCFFLKNCCYLCHSKLNNGFRRVLTTNNVRFFQETITENPVTVFSKRLVLHKLFLSQSKVSFSYCPFCTAIKKHFSRLEIDYKLVELDLAPEGDMYHDALKSATGQRTVPYVFIHGDLIGGYDDTSGIPNDVLLDMIKQK